MAQCAESVSPCRCSRSGQAWASRDLREEPAVSGSLSPGLLLEEAAFTPGVCLPESKATPTATPTAEVTEAKQPAPLTRTVSNARFRDVPGAFLVDLSASGLPKTLTAPQAVSLATSLARCLPKGTFRPDSVTEVVVVEDLSQVASLAASPSGQVSRLTFGGAVLDVDARGSFRRFYLPAARLDEQLRPTDTRALVEGYAPALASAQTLQVPPLQERALPSPLKAAASVFCSGLISVSAEPPEGFFAASTQAELEGAGWPSASADLADVWLMRVPDAREQSYFAFTYPSPGRPSDTPSQGKLKVAVGLGPAHNPMSQGGAEADLLWLGDEQHGALSGFLAALADPSLTLERLYRLQGFVQRLDGARVVLSGLDQKHALTAEGFSSLATSPSLYREVYSEEYDAFLLSLFRGEPAEHTYLLATSRGCSQGCAICASGGLTNFQYFSPERMMDELSKLAAHARMGPDETANVFFLDSNFNNNPGRLVEFSRLFADSELAGRMRFFVRHNTVNGFLVSDGQGGKRPNLELIRAYQQLGIDIVFMGVDTFDDASTRALKTNTAAVEKKGADARPTYRVEELRALLGAMEAHGLSARGFFLINNPWVSDLDRLDGYFNLLTLWLENPHFEVDARDSALRLKPFAGSPITDVAALLEDEVVEGNRFVARTALGELDELLATAHAFTPFCLPRATTGATPGLCAFVGALALLEERAQTLRQAAPEAAEQLLRKLVQRARRLEKELQGLSFSPEEVAAAQALSGALAALIERHACLGELSQEEQAEATRRALASLATNLGASTPRNLVRLHREALS